MDPLSIASGVAGLVTLADVVISRTYNTIIACKHASEDSRKLLREVQALAGILQSLFSLESKLGTAALQSHIPAAQILACQQTLQNIRNKLEKSDPKEDGISIFQKVKRTLKWPLSSSDTEKVLTEMERHKSTFDLALSVDALEAILSSQQAEKDIDSKIDGVAETLDKLSRIEVTKERRRLLQLVGAEDADGIHRDNLKIHQLGTGLWFLEPGKPFRTWQTAACSKLWVHGIPGAGKTILSALAIEQVAQTVSTFHGMIFYYCSHREEKSRQLTGILGSFIGQLARQDEKCMAILEDKCGVPDYTASQAWMSDVDDLLIVLRKMLRRFQDISVLIDGVDECHEATLVTDTLASIVANTPGCRILVFSRKEAEMEPLLEGFDQLSIAAESQDLRLYVPAQIEARTRLRKLRIRNPSVKDKIIEALVNEADGM
jgi:hypothetical protein